MVRDLVHIPKTISDNTAILSGGGHFIRVPVPLEVRYENSLTSCGMACTMNFQYRAKVLTSFVSVKNT